MPCKAKAHKHSVPVPPERDGKPLGGGLTDVVAQGPASVRGSRALGAGPGNASHSESTTGEAGLVETAQLGQSSEWHAHGR